MMNVPIDDRDAIDLRIVLLRVPRGDRDVIEQTEAHRSFARRVMTGRTYRNEGVLRFAFHDQIDRLARRPRTMFGRIERTHRNDRVGIEIANTFTHYTFHLFIELWR